VTEIALDHSALTEIYELTPRDREIVIKGIRLMGRLRITTANVLEAAGYGNKTIRDDKIGFYRELTGMLNPIAAPNDLLRKTATAHHQGKDNIDIGSDETMTLLHHPEYIEETYDESFTWNKERKHSFKEMHQELRDIYQEHFDKVPTDRATTALDLITYFCERLDDYLDILIIPFYERASGQTVSKDDARTFTQTNIAWRLFWASRIHAMYTRSVQQKGSSDKKNAGQTDLETAIYLGFTDTFITADRKQYEALMEINNLNPRKTKILWWPDVKKAFGL
jgi:hypothetical protein